MGPLVGVFGFPVMMQNQEFDPESGDVRCLLAGRESPGPLTCHGGQRCKGRQHQPGDQADGTAGSQERA